MKSGSKLTTPHAYDRVISVEILDKDKYPELLGLVISHMLHGPCGVCGGINPYTLTARHGQAQTRRFGPLHDDARARSLRWSLTQGIKPDLEVKQGLGRLG
jgi:hypothetical protein